MNFEEIPRETLSKFARFIPIVIVLLFIFPKLFYPLIPIGIFLFVLLSRSRQTGVFTSGVNVSPSMQPTIERLFGTLFNAAWKLVAVIALSIVLWNSFIVIPAGMTGVYQLFGKVSDNELHSGFHIINPLADVVLMTIRTEQYTMSASHEDPTPADSIDTLTKEGLKVTLDMTVLYHLDEAKASDVYKTLGEDYQEKIVRTEARSTIREVASLYEAKDIYSERREEVVKKIEVKMRAAMEPRGMILESVLVRNVILPAMLTTAIEAKLTAEQEAIKYDFTLQRETKEAERKRIEAAGQRDSQKIISSSLSKEYLQYLYIRELKDRQGTIYVPYDLPLFKGM